MGRPLKVSRRTRSILRALNAAPAKSSEQKKLEKEQARQARLKLKAQEKAAREAAKHQGPAQMVVQVQAPAKPEYIATVDRTTGTITRTPLPTAPQTAPEPAEEPVTSANPNMPIWVQEGRSATRAEWEAHQAARTAGPSAGASFADNGGIVSHNQSVEHLARGSSTRNGWRTDGTSNWRQKL